MKTIVALSLLLAVASALDFPLNGRIVGGEVAARGQFPYQAGISTTKGGKNYWCGGSIISDQWILTAAHCTVGVTKFVVWLGVNKVNTATLQSGGLKFTITDLDNVITHADYKASTLINDIALIKLPRKIEFTEYIQKIDLPPRADSYPSYDNEPVVASGWGKPSDTAAGITSILQFVDLTVLNLKSCGRYYLPGLVKSSNICVDTVGGKSTCGGDSGGPLVAIRFDYLVGVTSFGAQSGCEKNIPAAFTRVTSYLDWIETHTGISS